ncbi:coiled-coil domain-containing protein 50 [Pogona vitticeps]
MAEISIDQSKLPRVKEVCRDFAVLEDHTLAHSLQEQEIEHHLATNVQRNRLVQHDLQMAKQLQEEEDRKARARNQKQHKDLERQDCEIAQEIQVKLVIEAEQRRRQEEDDEDIARILQQKELQGEKRRKKPPPEAGRPSPYEEEGYSLESRDRQPGSPTGQPSEPSRSGSADRPPRQTRDDPRGPPLVSEGLELEVLGSSSDVKKARGGRRHPREAQREKKAGSHEKLWKDAEDGLLEGGGSRTRASREGKVPSASAERLRETSPPRREAGHGSRERQERRPRSRERPPRASPLVDWEVEGAGLAHDRHRKHREGQSPGSEKSLKPTDGNIEDQEEKRSRRRPSRSPRPDGPRTPPHQDRPSSRSSSHDRRRRGPDTPPQRGPRRPGERERERGRDGTPASHYGESSELDARRRRHPGTKPRGTKEATYSKPRGVPPQDQESYDAEIARKLQEEELLASQVDKRAAQVAQDEEIARLLMAEEKAAYKKAREKEKLFAEKKRQDPGWKHDTPESVPPRSREGHEPHRGRSDKPTRPPPPPTEDLDYLVNLTSQQNSAYQIPKPESSQKGAGYHYKP